MASITVMGYAPTSPLYSDVAAEPNAKVDTNHFERGSSQYESIITATETEPKIVSMSHSQPRISQSNTDARQTDQVS